MLKGDMEPLPWKAVFQFHELAKCGREERGSQAQPWLLPSADVESGENGVSMLTH